MMIFSHLDEKSLARSACVRKDWAELALDLLWRNVDDLRRLLSLLCPFTKPEKGTNTQGYTIYLYKFRRRLTLHDWEQFQRYSTRVRRIVYHQKSARLWRKLLDPSVFAEISRTCPTPAIFPNLQSLVWNAESIDIQMHSLVFTHHRLKQLEVRLHKCGQPFISYIQQMAMRVPELTQLTLKFGTSVRIFEDEIICLSQRLQKLRKFTVPLYGLTPRIVEGLSELEGLQEVALGGPTEFGNGLREDVAQFFPALQEGAFPSARRLCFSCQLPDATRFLQSRYFPSHICSLYIHILAIVEPHVIQQLFVAVRDSCPRLLELHVDFMICPDVSLTVPSPRLYDRPDITTFRPLFTCRHITSFEFRWDYALNLTDGDMEEFATSWPALEHLLLNCEPVIEFAPPLLTLKSLLPFARHCCKLRKLGLYTNTDVPLSDPVIVPFKSLEQLFVGASNISSVDRVALFLSQLCSLDCKIVAGLRWPDAYGIALDDAGIFDERRTRMCDFWVRWNEVMKVLPLMTKARMEEKARMAALQREVEMLAKARLEEAERSQRLEQEVLALRLRCGLPPIRV